MVAVFGFLSVWACGYSASILMPGSLPFTMERDRGIERFPCPQVIVQELRDHVQELKELHRQDLSKGYGGVFLVNALEKKYKNAARQFVW
jgi:hypothetical protein